MLLIENYTEINFVRDGLRYLLRFHYNDDCDKYIPSCYLLNVYDKKLKSISVPDYIIFEEEKYTIDGIGEDFYDNIKRVSTLKIADGLLKRENLFLTENVLVNKGITDGYYKNIYYYIRWISSSAKIINFPYDIDIDCVILQNNARDIPKRIKRVIYKNKIIERDKNGKWKLND